MKYYPLFFFLLFMCTSSCKEQVVDNLKIEPKLSITGNSLLEGDEGNSTIEVTVRLSGEYEGKVSVDYETLTESAFRGLDFEYQNATLEFTAPESEKIISIKVIADQIKEGNEEFVVALSSPTNAEIETSRATVLIKNDDDQELALPVEGYSTPTAYEGFELVWADEFEGEAVNEEDWTFEIGNGNNGWGNNELEYYTDRPENVRIENGQLIIEAREESFGGFPYTSTRMKTQDKRIFQFGRIDIRAKLPKGQGIWPALWMLGNDISSVSWPACGEIDIVELVGHEPKTIHGTAHWGSNFSNHKFKGASYSIGEDFSDRFHVFSIQWKQGVIYWYINDILYYSFSTQQAQGQPYPFNDQFFFLFNVAVGGNWPGRPDATTFFPQQMIVDYVRVFQEEK
ncbi:MAG: family 16 glycosylhydrolase [Bacteroidota bacterium]